MLDTNSLLMVLRDTESTWCVCVCVITDRTVNQLLSVDNDGATETSRREVRGVMMSIRVIKDNESGI